MTSYVEIISQLPAPKPEQTRAFARFITGAHSWYKHLPWQQYCPFYFYLDPNAGCELVTSSEGCLVSREQTEESCKFHYTRQTTESYRRRFGYWNYAQSYGQAFMYDTGEGIATTEGTPLKIRIPGHGWIKVPPSLKLAGTALVNAYMYDEVGYFEEAPKDLEQWQQENLKYFISLPSPIGYFDIDKVSECRFFGLSMTFDEVNLKYHFHGLSNLPANIAAALRPLFSLWKTVAYLNELREACRPYEQFCKTHKSFPSKKELKENNSWQNPFFSETYRMLCKEIETKWEQTNARQHEHKLLAPLIAALDAERKRQIEGMVKAMLRFLETLESAA